MKMYESIVCVYIYMYIYMYIYVYIYMLLFSRLTFIFSQMHIIMEIDKGSIKATSREVKSFYYA